jgi:hypothetical protein
VTASDEPELLVGPGARSTRSSAKPNDAPGVAWEEELAFHSPSSAGRTARSAASESAHGPVDAEGREPLNVVASVGVAEATTS